MDQPSPIATSAAAQDNFRLRIERARAALSGGDNDVVAYLLGITRADVDRIAPPGAVAPHLKVDDSVVRRLARGARTFRRTVGSQ
jgi:hypothetical protein